MRALIYDVETANAKDIGSICAVGWVLIENDIEIDCGYSLINPKCEFAKQNIAIHGITANDVANTPCFCDYWNNTLGSLMSSSIIMAHSADFDLSATEQALYSAGIEDPGLCYIDTLAMFRAMFLAKSYKLQALAKDIMYDYEAHNALDDAKALKHILFSVRDIFHHNDLATMIIKSGVPSKNTLTNKYVPHEIKQVYNELSSSSHGDGSISVGNHPKFSYDNSSRCKEDVDIIDDCLTGLRFCFTGDISGYDRYELEKIIKQHGGRMTSSVSSKTDYLVVGTYEDLGTNYVSGKQKAAIELIEHGGKIQIILPSQFFAMIGNDERS